MFLIRSIPFVSLMGCCQHSIGCIGGCRSTHSRSAMFTLNVSAGMVILPALYNLVVPEGCMLYDVLAIFQNECIQIDERANAIENTVCDPVMTAPP